MNRKPDREGGEGRTGDVRNVPFSSAKWLSWALSKNSQGSKEEGIPNVDDFELKAALRDIRHEASLITDPKQRDAYVKKIRTETLGDPNFTRMAGQEARAAFSQLLGQTDGPLLYRSGGALERPSAIREDLLSMLVGIKSDHLHYYVAKELAAKVPSNERTLAIAQLREAREQLDETLVELPPSTGNREGYGTYRSKMEERFRNIIDQTIARLQCSTFAAQLDVFADPVLRHPTGFNPAVSQRAFQEILESAKKASAVPETRTLWIDVKNTMGNRLDWGEPQKAFQKIVYSGDPVGPSFLEDVATVDKIFELQHKSTELRERSANRRSTKRSRAR